MEKINAIQILTALGHDTRMDVFRLLVKAASYTPGEGGLAAGDIASQLDLPAPTLSFHLKEMSRAGLVEGQRRGRSIHYTARTETLQSVAQFLLVDCCQGEGCNPETDT
jgi:ArsR family transcriptional regulator